MINEEKKWIKNDLISQISSILLPTCPTTAGFLERDLVAVGTVGGEVRYLFHDFSLGYSQFSLTMVFFRLWSWVVTTFYRLPRWVDHFSRISKSGEDHKNKHFTIQWHTCYCFMLLLLGKTRIFLQFFSSSVSSLFVPSPGRLVAVSIDGLMKICSLRGVELQEVKVQIFHCFWTNNSEKSTLIVPSRLLYQPWNISEWYS